MTADVSGPTPYERRREVEAWLAEIARAHFATEDGAAHRSVAFGIGEVVDGDPERFTELLVLLSDRPTPRWPHACTYPPGAPPAEVCSRCMGTELLRRFQRGWSTGQPIREAFQAFSPDVESPGARVVPPSLLARRVDGGEVEVAQVGQVQRPWLDAPEANVPPAPSLATAVPHRRLLDEVRAHPADDGLRRVLIDAWVEAGDPRGEYGALCFGPRNPATLRRRRALEIAHGRSWAGALDPLLTWEGRAFERGPFLTRAVLARGVPSSHRELPEWATVESLTLLKTVEQVLPVAPALHEVRLLRSSGLRALLTHPPAKLKAIQVVRAHQELTTLCELPACPTLEALSLLGPADLDLVPLRSAPACRSLRRLEQALLVDGETLESNRGFLALVRPPPWPELESSAVVLATQGGLPTGWRLEWAREGGVTLSLSALGRWSGEAMLRALVDRLLKRGEAVSVRPSPLWQPDGLMRAELVSQGARLLPG